MDSQQNSSPEKGLHGGASDSPENKGMELYKKLRDQEKSITEKISEMDQEMLTLYNQIEDLQGQQVVVSEDEDEGITESAVASPTSPEMQVEVEF